MIQLNSKSLFDVVKDLGAVIKDSHGMPFLRLVRVEFKGNKITAIGDDLETRVEVSGEFEGEFEKIFCVDYSLFRKSLASLPNQPIKLIFEKTKLYIKAAKTEFKLSLEDSGAFPTSKLKFDSPVKLHSAEFIESVLLSSKMIDSKDELSPLSNIHCCFNGKVSIYGSSHHHGYKQVINQDSKEDKTFLISSRSAPIMFKMLSSEEEIELSIEDRAIELKQENLRIVTLLPTAKPINIEGLFKSLELDIPLNVDVEQFYTIIKSLYNFTDVSIKTANLKLSNKKLLISLYDSANIIGCNYEIDCENDAELDIYYNISNLHKTLSLFSSPDIFITNKKVLYLREGDREALMTPSQSPKANNS